MNKLHSRCLGIIEIENPSSEANHPRLIYQFDDVVHRIGQVAASVSSPKIVGVTGRTSRKPMIDTTAKMTGVVWLDRERLSTELREEHTRVVKQIKRVASVAALGR